MRSDNEPADELQHIYFPDFPDFRDFRYSRSADDAVKLARASNQQAHMEAAILPRTGNFRGEHTTSRRGNAGAASTSDWRCTCMGPCCVTRGCAPHPPPPHHDRPRRPGGEWSPGSRHGHARTIPPPTPPIARRPGHDAPHIPARRARLAIEFSWSGSESLSSTPMGRDRVTVREIPGVMGPRGRGKPSPFDLGIRKSIRSARLPFAISLSPMFVDEGPIELCEEPQASTWRGEAGRAGGPCGEKVCAHAPRSSTTGLARSCG